MQELSNKSSAWQDQSTVKEVILRARHFMQSTCKLCESFLKGVAGDKILCYVKSD